MLTNDSYTGWFGHKETIIHKNEGTIYAIKWFKNLIAWANDQGVKIYNVQDNEKLSYIPRPKGSENCGICRCNLVWFETPEGEERLIVGWGTSVTVLSLKEKVYSPNTPNSMMTPRDVKPQKVVEVMTMFQTEFLICGIQPYGEDKFLLLAYDTSGDSEVEEENGAENQEVSAPRPELRILDIHGEELSCDALSIKNYEHYSVHDYRLEYCQTDNAYYILSQRDIVVAKPRDLDDHVQWLLSKESFDEALKFVKEQEKNGIKLKEENSAENIGRKYILWLLEGEKWEEAAAYVPQVSGNNKDEWEKWIWVFFQKKKFEYIVSYIPIPGSSEQNNGINSPILSANQFDNNNTLESTPTDKQIDQSGNKVDLPQVRLSDTIYEMLLNHYLMNNADQLLRTIKQIPKELYDVQHIIIAVQEQLEKMNPKKQENVTEEDKARITALLNTLAQLYISEKKYDRTLDIYLQSKQPSQIVFPFIEKHQLFSEIQDKVVLLLELDETRALELFVNHLDQMKIEKVVLQLKDKRRLLHKYLDALFRKHSSKASEFHILQVELYAEFDTEKLLWFLEQSQSYNIEKAKDICEHFLSECEEQIELLSANNNNASESDAKLLELKKERDRLYRSIVYLLGRMGNTNEALGLIIEKLQDVNLAIEFVEKQHDTSLWKDLIDHSLKNGTFLSGLLDCVDYTRDGMDPIELISKIKDNMQIPNLKNKLASIINDKSLQLTLQRGCQQVLNADTRALSLSLYKKQRKGVKVGSTKRCPICGNFLRNSSKDHNLLFMCGHAYHVSCFTQQVPERQKSETEQQKSEHRTAYVADDIDSITGRSMALSTDRYRHQLEEKYGPLKCILCNQVDKKKDPKTTRGKKRE